MDMTNSPPFCMKNYISLDPFSAGVSGTMGGMFRRSALTLLVCLTELDVVASNRLTLLRSSNSLSCDLNAPEEGTSRQAQPKLRGRIRLQLCQLFRFLPLAAKFRSTCMILHKWPRVSSVPQHHIPPAVATEQGERKLERHEP